MLRPIVVTVALLLCSFAFSIPPLLDKTQPEAAVPARIVDFTSPDFKRIRGTLTTHQGSQTESIVLGEKSGIYGTGLVFHSSVLPPGIAADLADRFIIQIAFGITPEKAGERNSRFASVSLISQKMVTKPVFFKTALPQSPKKTDETALVVFSSPNGKKDPTDDERLKMTFFAESGGVEVAPLGKSEPIELTYQSTRYPFREQTFRLNFKSVLSTPFNESGNKISGSVEVPVYWPRGKASESLVKKFTSQSLTGPISLPFLPDNFNHRNRDVAGSAKSKRPPSVPDPAPSKD